MAEAQNRLVGIVKGDTVSTRPTEWSAIVAGRKSYGKCRFRLTTPKTNTLSVEP